MYVTIHLYSFDTNQYDKNQDKYCHINTGCTQIHLASNSCGRLVKCLQRISGLVTSRYASATCRQNTKGKQTKNSNISLSMVQWSKSICYSYEKPRCEWNEFAGVETRDTDSVNTPTKLLEWRRSYSKRMLLSDNEVFPCVNHHFNPNFRNTRRDLSI